MPTSQEIIQDKIDNLDQYSPEDQLVIRHAAQRLGVTPSMKGRAQRGLTDIESSWPFLGNLLDQVGRNVAAVPQGLSALFQTMTPHPDPSSPTGQTGGLGALLPGIVGGAGQELRQQQQQAGQEITSGHPLYGALRSLVGGVVPGVGPDIMNIIDQSFGRGKYGHADPGGATANALSMGAQLAGPDIMRALGAPTRGLGEAIQKGSFDFGKEISLTDRAKIVKMAQELKLPTGQKSIDFLGDTTDSGSFLGQAEAGVQKAIAGVKGQYVSWDTILRPIQDEIDALDPRAPGAAQRQTALINEMNRFKKSNGWEPAKIDKKTGVITPEKAMDPITVADAQKLKRTTYRLNSPSLYSDTAPLAPESKAANVLNARGLKDAIEEVAPGVKPYNDSMHTAIQLQDSLVDAEKTHPGFLKNWIKWIGGAGGAIAGAGFAASAGHPLAGSSFLAGALAAQAVRDPAVASRLGLALQHAGTDPASLMLGLAPGAGRVGQLLQPPPTGQVGQ